MRLGPVRVATPTLLVVLLAAALCGAFLVGGTTSTAAFTPYNQEWDGLSDVRTIGTEAGAEPTTMTTVDRYAAVPANGTIALVVSPPAYTEAERVRLRQFVEGGGTLVVAARDPSRADPLLQSLGANITVDGAPLRDEQEYGRSPDFPLVTTVAERSVARNAAGLSLNYGTALEIGNESDARAVANSSAFSYLDRDGDRAPDSEESLGAQPVVATQSIGAGSLVVVSDPSVFINAMLEREANSAFAATLIEGHDRLLIDRTASSVPPVIALLTIVRDSSVLGALTVIACLASVLGWERRLDRRLRDRLPGRTDDVFGGQTSLDPETVATYLEGERTDWNDDRRDRVLGGIMRTRQQSHHDDRDD